MPTRRIGLDIAVAAISLVSTGWAQQLPSQFGWAEGCPGDPGLDPVGKIVATDFVELQSKSGCMDGCPIYSVRVRGDGMIIWNGVRGVRTEGPATRQVSAEDARALIESYRGKGFWRICHPSSGGDDGPELITTVHIGDREKSIRGTPDWEIYREVGVVAGTYVWIRGEQAMDTVDGSMQPDNEFAPKPGFTDLMRAASRGDVDGIRSELKAGAKVKAQDSSGFTALMYGARASDSGVLQMLLKAGADPNLRSNLGQTAIMAASTDWTDRSKNIQILISAGGNLNALDDQGDSALMLALSPITVRGRPRAVPELISFLLKAGARKNLRDKMGLTALSRVEAGLSFAKSESDMLKSIDGGNRVGRQADLEIEIQQLEQVREFLVRR